MAIIGIIDKDAVVKKVSKTKAKMAADYGCDQSSTAKGAADVINNSGYGKSHKAYHQDNFDVNTDRYKNSDDYARKADDGRFVVVTKKTE